MNEYKVTILGAGLAGCEAALWLAGKGVQVELYEQKPVHFSPWESAEAANGRMLRRFRKRSRSHHFRPLPGSAVRCWRSENR